MPEKDINKASMTNAIEKAEQIQKEKALTDVTAPIYSDMDLYSNTNDNSTSNSSSSLFMPGVGYIRKDKDHEYIGYFFIFLVFIIVILFIKFFILKKPNNNNSSLSSSNSKQDFNTNRVDLDNEYKEKLEIVESLFSQKHLNLEAKNFAIDEIKEWYNTRLSEINSKEDLYNQQEVQKQLDKLGINFDKLK